MELYEGKVDATNDYNVKAYIVKSCNIDYYLPKTDDFPRRKPLRFLLTDYMDGILLDDNTFSAFDHEKPALTDNLEKLKTAGEIELILWSDVP